MKEISALVIGGGIAGALTSMALQKVGISTRLFEAHPKKDSLTAGAWLTVAVNGLVALDSLNLLSNVKAVGFPSECIELRSGSGKLLGKVPLGGRLADGTVTHTMKRADLLSCLYDALADRGIPTETRRLVSLRQESGGVTALFADGHEARADFVVGADGVHSTVRHNIDSAAPRARYAGLGNIGGFAPAGAAAARPGEYSMIFGKKGFFGYTSAPSGEVWWFANPPSVKELTSVERLNTNWRQYLTNLFADDRGPMLELIHSTPGPFVYANQYDLPRVSNWHQGRVVLVGDAAHAATPSSGQGASMAAEDAVALAASFKSSQSIPEAFARFLGTRKARAERVVAYGRRYSSAKAAGPVARRLRDLLLPMVLRMQARPSSQQSLNWLYNHREPLI